MPRRLLVAKVFVGSADDLAGARSNLLADIQAMNREFDPDALMIESFDYRMLPAEVGHPQSIIDGAIARSDLAILLFGQHVRPGIWHELHETIRLHDERKLQTLQVYFQKVARAPEDEEQIATVRGEVSSLILYNEFVDIASLRDIVRNNLRRWLAPLRDVRRIDEACERDEEIARTIRVEDPPFTNEVFALEKLGPAKVKEGAAKALAEYRRSGGLMSPGQFYLVAHALRDRIASDDPTACGDRQFRHPVHQFLSYRLRKDKRENPREYRSAERNLQRWIRARGEVLPTARDFAVFQLGMCRSSGSREILEDALTDRGETQAVRYYAGMALGMIARRDSLPTIIQVHDETTDPDLRQVLAHAALAVAGMTTL